MPAPWYNRDAGIYVASKIKHAPMWLEFRAMGYPICSTWLGEWQKGQTKDWSALWGRAILEASQAPAMVIYQEPGEVMKGALVELGAALAGGGLVFEVGLQDRSRAHSHVVWCANVQEAMLRAYSHLLGEVPREVGRCECGGALVNGRCLGRCGRGNTRAHPVLCTDVNCKPCSMDPTLRFVRGAWINFEAYHRL